ncbi:hypothetical protein ElyMa_000171500 [Elysia marginata]|uniref:Uncharacterized protein n=1 Tax=Elysia marginata TaxID=1093978 RepID=A0AAV4EST8_9GAST|nr:hypothetical protein ElyMa_000171500 [Elysia marginata]
MEFDGLVMNGVHGACEVGGTPAVALMRVRRKTFAAGVLLVVCVTTLLLLSSPRTQDEHVSSAESEDPLLEQRLVELQGRLQEAENLNKKREDELFDLLSRMGPAGAQQVKAGNSLNQPDVPAASANASNGTRRYV